MPCLHGRLVRHGGRLMRKPLGGGRRVSTQTLREKDVIMSTSNSATDLPQRLAEEAQLDFLLGDWQATGVVHPGRFGPGGPSTGTSHYRWELDHKWLMYTSRLHLPGLGLYEVRGGVTYDSRAGVYQAFAVNNLGVLLVYTGVWESETRLVFTLIHPPAQEQARVVYLKSSDGTVQLISESSPDGVRYQAYFETTLARG
jgi:hypothetical protein